MIDNPIRTLFITRGSLYPPMAGAPLRNWQNTKLMMELGPVAVFSPAANPEEWNHSTETPPGLDLWSSPRVDREIPTWKKIAYRLRQPGWLPIPSNLNVGKYYTDSISRELERVLEEFQPQLVIFEELWLYPCLRIVKRHQCQTILDNHNVETILNREIHKEKSVKDLKSLKAIKSKVMKSIKLAEIESLERAFIRQVNQVWVCSNRDATLIRTLYGKIPDINVVPNGVNISYYDSVRMGNCEFSRELERVPQTFIFVGSFGYEPNELAARLLIDKIYPQLKAAYPNCRLLLVGSNPSQTVMEAAKQEAGIVVTGKVPDVRPYLSASSAVVVPLLQGGGTRLKILEAFAAGCPVVSTSKGAEGLKVRHDEHLLIGNNPEDLVAGVSRIWTESSLGPRLAGAAYEYVKTEYSWEAIAMRLKRIIPNSVCNSHYADRSCLTPQSRYFDFR